MGIIPEHHQGGHTGSMLTEITHKFPAPHIPYSHSAIPATRGEKPLIPSQRQRTHPPTAGTVGGRNGPKKFVVDAPPATGPATPGGGAGDTVVSPHPPILPATQVEFSRVHHAPRSPGSPHKNTLFTAVTVHAPKPHSVIPPACGHMVVVPGGEANTPNTPNEGRGDELRGEGG